MIFMIDKIDLRHVLYGNTLNVLLLPYIDNAQFRDTKMFSIKLLSMFLERVMF